MQVTVFGANGKVGKLVVAELLSRGHQVVAFVHTSTPPQQERVKIIKGDVYDKASVAAALKDSQAIVSTLGSWGTKQKNVLTSAVEKLIPAMEAHGITRIVSLTGSGASIEGEKQSWLTRVSNLPLVAFAPKVLRDGEDHLLLLSKSDLDWTVVRSPVMTKRTNTTYKLQTFPSSLSISRTAVAKAVVDLVETNAWIKRAPHIGKD